MAWAVGATALPALSAIAIIAALAGILDWRQGDTAASAAIVAFTVLASGVADVLLLQFVALIQELRRAQDDLAGMAVAAERRRFARDLHDLLGYSLSSIVATAEIVRRLAARDADRAAAEATEIESIGRRALDEVRDAVTGYREMNLRHELEQARASLRQAGVAPTVDYCVGLLPAFADHLFAWVLREGVTNVLRHSRARHCRIEVSRRDERLRLLVQDDGVGGDREVEFGNGLRGLAERALTANGRLEAGPQPGGGFLLVVELPLPVVEVAR